MPALDHLPKTYACQFAQHSQGDVVYCSFHSHIAAGGIYLILTPILFNNVFRSAPMAQSPESAWQICKSQDSIKIEVPVHPSAHYLNSLLETEFLVVIVQKSGQLCSERSAERFSEGFERVF